jgi:hypothetical protein
MPGAPLTGIGMGVGAAVGVLEMHPARNITTIVKGRIRPDGFVIIASLGMEIIYSKSNQDSNPINQTALLILEI